VQVLTDRFQRLESEIELVEAENQELAEEIQESMTENTTYCNSFSERRTTRRSTVGNYLSEPDNESDLFTEENDYSGDPMVRRYLDAFR